MGRSEASGPARSRVYGLKFETSALRPDGSTLRRNAEWVTARGKRGLLEEARQLML